MVDTVTLTRPTRRTASRSTDLLAVGAIQGGGAATRFAFQVVLARALSPTSFADIAVALGWTQVIASAIGGGTGAYLFTSLPKLFAGHAVPEAAVRYRRAVMWSVASSSVVALVVALALTSLSAAGATAAGLAVLATAGLRAAVIASQESARGLGALVVSQLLTNVVQPALAVVLLVSAARSTDGPIDALIAPAALLVSLGVVWGGQHSVVRARLPARWGAVRRAPRTTIDRRSLLRLGAASAMLTWMVEGTLVLTSFVVDDKVEVARFAAHLRLSVVTSIAAITVSTVASTQWTRRVRAGGDGPSLREALRWSALGAAVASGVAAVLLVVAGRALDFFGEAYEYSPAVLGGLVAKDVAVAAASPIFYFLVMRGRTRAAARASFLGAVALLVVPIGGLLGGLVGASAAAAGAGLVWLGSYVLAAFRVDRVAR